MPYEHEDRLPALFASLKAHAGRLGVADVQLRLTPLEEVFLTVARKAEHEHAQVCSVVVGGWWACVSVMGSKSCRLG